MEQLEIIVRKTSNAETMEKKNPALDYSDEMSKLLQAVSGLGLEVKVLFNHKL